MIFFCLFDWFWKFKPPRDYKSLFAAIWDSQVKMSQVFYYRDPGKANLFLGCEWLRYSYPGGRRKIFLLSLTVPWNCVNNKCGCFILVDFYPDLLHCFKGSNPWEVVLKKWSQMLGNLFAKHLRRMSYRF